MPNIEETSKFPQYRAGQVLRPLEPLVKCLRSLPRDPWTPPPRRWRVNEGGLLE